MRQFLIVKTGSTLPALLAQRGDFEDWFISGMGLSGDKVRIVDVCKGVPLPGFNEISGVVVTGSHDMVTDRLAWSERTAEWLCRAVEAGLPILAVCYGHQLLAHALGGEVDYNPRGREMGTVDVFLTEEANGDELLGNYRSPIQVQVSHAQSVVQLPKNAIRLGWSQDDPNQAFRIGKRVWGLQFHPEFDKEIVQIYINYHREALIKEGQDPDALIRNSEDTEFGRQILKRFAQLVQSQECPFFDSIFL
jgi:GMP synthase (glutamine-hydrolysing)